MRKSLLTVGAALALVLVGVATEPIAEVAPMLLLAWLLIIVLVWAEGTESGLLAALLLLALLALGPEPGAAWQKGAVLGVFLGCLHEGRPAVAKWLVALSLLAAIGLSEPWTAAALAAAFLAALVLRRSLPGLEAFSLTAISRLRRDVTAVSAYLLLFFAFVLSAGLSHRALDIHRAQPELQFMEWKGAGPAPISFYIYFTTTTSLTGPPSDVSIKGPLARWMVTGEVVVGMLFLALVLKQLLALTTDLLGAVRGSQIR